MKKLILQIICAMLSCVIIFGSIVYVVMNKRRPKGVEAPKDDVPYYQADNFPENTTLLCTFDDGYGAVFEILFEQGIMNVLILKDPTEELANQYGYYVTETSYMDYRFIMDFIDSVDGIELDIFGEKMRYTGVQICNIIAVNKDSLDTKIQILTSCFEKINKNGFSSESLSCIINNSETTLSTPDCYGWTDYVGSICGAVNIVNEG